MPDRAAVAVAMAVLVVSPTLSAQDTIPVSEAKEAPKDDGRARFGSFGVAVGLTGVALDYALPLGRYFDLRVGGDVGNFNGHTSQDGNHYKAKLKFGAGFGKIDYMPFGGGFRLIAGAYSRPPKVKLHASGRDDYDFGGLTYTGDLDVDGSVDLGRKVAPYAGFGFGNTPNGRGLGFSFELGAMFAHSPNVGLDVDGRACNATVVSCDPDGITGFDVNGNDVRAVAFQQQVEQERKDLEHNAKDYNLWPVLNFGIGYRF